MWFKDGFTVDFEENEAKREGRQVAHVVRKPFLLYNTIFFNKRS